MPPEYFFAHGTLEKYAVRLSRNYISFRNAPDIFAKVFIGICLQVGGLHRAEEFASRGKEPKEEVQVRLLRGICFLFVRKQKPCSFN